MSFHAPDKMLRFQSHGTQQPLKQPLSTVSKRLRKILSEKVCIVHFFTYFCNTVCQTGSNAEIQRGPVGNDENKGPEFIERQMHNFQPEEPLSPENNEDVTIGNILIITSITHLTI